MKEIVFYRIPKDILKECFSSREMIDYLANQFLTTDMVSDIVRGAPISLARKREIFSLLWEESGKKQFADMIGELDIAIQELREKPGEIFYVRQHWFNTEENREDHHGLAPYLTLEKAMQGIRLLGTVEGIPTCGCWHELEKWVTDLKGNLEHRYTYLVLDKDICFFKHHTGLYNPGFSGYRGMRLPTPFQPGDIITIDCQPFGPVTYGVVLGNECGGDSYLWGVSRFKEGWQKGTVEYGWLIDPTVEMPFSPFYRLSRLEGELPSEDEPLGQVSEHLAGDKAKGEALWHMLHMPYGVGLSAEQLLACVKQ